MKIATLPHSRDCHASLALRAHYTRNDSNYMNLSTILKQYGLNEKQAKIYLTCLELGSSSVQKISKKAELARSSCYEILESLKKQGLISEFKKKTIRYFSAEDPKKIITQAQEKATLLEKALPQFNAIYKKTGDQPTVRFYKGKEGMKLILDEITKEATELLSFGSVDDLWELLGDYWYTFVKKRIKNKIPARVILRDSVKARERQRLGVKELREVRIMLKDFEHHGIIFIWQNKIAMFSFENEHMALVIENKILAQSQRIMFEMIWEGLKK